jgi:uncharacterized protein (UPF0332 family)
LPNAENYINKSKEKLEASKVLYKSRFYGDSVSVAYYAMFSSAKALLFLKNITPKTHSGLMSSFGKEFVKTGQFDKYLFKRFIRSQKKREEADYEDVDFISKKIAKNIIDLAETFVVEYINLLEKIKK